jgi:hypothetical protein
MSTRRAPKRRKPASKISLAAAGRQADQILKDLESRARDFKGRKQEVAILSKEELVRKIRGETSHSPFIVLLSWFASAPRGTTITATLGIYNPDPITYLSSDLFAHAFWGPGNVVNDLDAYLLSADSAFPRLGVGVDAPPSLPITFATVSIPLPASVAAGTYLMNWILFLRNAFGVGTVLERASVYTALT